MSNRREEIAASLARVQGAPWVIAAAAITVGVALLSVKDIEPGEVAVRVNNLTGSQEALTQPGWTLRLPLIHSLYMLDAKPQTFLMKGTEEKDDLHVPELTVRASDGSNFHFTDTTILFQVKGDEAVQVFSTSGAGNGFLSRMKPYARAILRDEFGRESTIHVSDPTSYGAAANRSKERLNRILGPHGIVVTQLVTPRPRFNEGYEQTIEERNSLSNELEVIRSNLDRAATDRDRQLAEVDQAKNHIIQERHAALESQLAQAIAKQADVRREVDTYRISKVADGQAALSGAQHRSIELKGELLARYAAKLAEVSAFKNQPLERVMEKLGQRLAGVTISIQPWADDAAPSSIRLQKEVAP